MPQPRHKNPGSLPVPLDCGRVLAPGEIVDGELSEHDRRELVAVATPRAAARRRSPASSSDASPVDARPVPRKPRAKARSKE